MCSFTVLFFFSSKNQSVSGVTIICLTQCNTSTSHGVDQVVDCGGMLVHSSSMAVWSCWILAGTGTRCRIRWSRASQTCSMGDMSGEYVGHARTGMFSASRNCVQILATWGRALSCWTWDVRLATSVALCCVIKLHILDCPFIVVSLRHSCAIIMLSNQHLDMPHLWGGWIISAKEKCSLTQI